MEELIWAKLLRKKVKLDRRATIWETSHLTLPWLCKCCNTYPQYTQDSNWKVKTWRLWRTMEENMEDMLSCISLGGRGRYLLIWSLLDPGQITAVLFIPVTRWCHHLILLTDPTGDTHPLNPRNPVISALIVRVLRVLHHITPHNTTTSLQVYRYVKNSRTNTHYC